MSTQADDPWSNLQARAVRLGHRPHTIIGLRTLIADNETPMVAGLPDRELHSFLDTLVACRSAAVSELQGEAMIEALDRLIGLAAMGFPLTQLQSTLHLLGVKRIPDWNPAQIRRWLGRRLSGVSWVVQVEVLMLSAILLVNFDRQEEAERLLLAIGGVTIDEFDDMSAVLASLQRNLAGVPNQLIGHYFRTLGTVRHYRHGDQHAIAYYKALLAVTDSPYSPEQFAGYRRYYWWNDMVQTDLVLKLIACHLGCGHTTEASQLLWAFLGSSPTRHLNARQCVELISQRLQAISEPTTAAIFVMWCTWSVSRDIAPAVGFGALALLMGSSIEAWNDPDRIAEDVRDYTQLFPVPHFDTEMYLHVASGLASVGRDDDARRLLARHLLDSPEVTGDTELFVRRILERSENLHGSTRGTIMLVLLPLLDPNRDRRVTCNLLINYLGLVPEDFDEPSRLAQRIHTVRKLLLFGQNLSLAATLVATLIEDADESRAATLASTLLWSVLDFSEPDLHEAGALSVCRLLEQWLEVCGEAEGERLVPRCRQVVQYLRNVLEIHGLKYEDRRQFHLQIARLRGAIGRRGRDRASALPPGPEADEAWIESTLWDVELGQRVLLERMRLEFVPDQSVEQPGGLGDEWPLFRSQPLSDNYLPADPAREVIGAFGRFSMAHRVARHAATAIVSDTRQNSLSESMRTIIAHGIDRMSITKVLGEHGVFLKAAFDTEGSLSWAAIAAGDCSLRVLSSGRSCTANALDDLRSAVRWHDQVLEAIWTNLPDLKQEARDILADVDELRRMFSTRRQAAPLIDDKYDHRIRSLTEVAGDLLRPWVLSAASLADASQRSVAWRELSEALNRLCEAPKTDCLDIATRLFIGWVDRHWDLSSLIERLDSQTDLVIEVEDVLHAVPVAFLGLVGTGKCLFERVATVRSSLSLLIDAVERDPSPIGRRIATVSWFEPTDETVRPGEAWLHAGQRWLADRYGYQWVGAAERPEGSARAVAMTVSGQQSLRLLTVCGHGDPQRSGVALSDGLWDASGLDFSRVGWLMMVSCSIGRVGHALASSGTPDVEGFTTQLVAGRAAAALVCRWPVHAMEAPWFANAVADEYLRPGDCGRAVRRADALAAARRRFLRNDVSHHRVIGLNTMAAFEHYGQI